MIRESHVRNTLLVLLAGAAGGVDAVSYLLFEQVFTATMTGNTVLLGLAVVNMDRHAVMRSGLALAGFLVGSLLVAWMVRRRQAETVWPASVTVALGLEIGVLSLLTGFWHWAQLRPAPPLSTAIVILLAALAMGMQSSAVRRLEVSGISTTYITGTLTSLIMQLVEHPSRARLRAPAPTLEAPRTAHGALLATVWLLYIGGAMGAAIAIRSNLKLLALLFPIAVILVVALTALAYFRRGSNA